MSSDTMFDIPAVTFPQAVEGFAAKPPYRPSTERYLIGNPYHRPLDGARLSAIDWTRPLTEATFVSDESLMVNRYLMNIYESDALFLPSTGLTGKLHSDFEEFYSPQTRLLGELGRGRAERFVLGFLDDGIRTAGQWDVASVQAHLEGAIDDASQAALPVLDQIVDSPDPVRAAHLQIAQMALDGLTEATAMSQNLGGAFGPEQSELFKIFIDEFGYGVNAAKHSTLFTDLSASVGMATEAHHYWFFYLPTSTAVNNYFYAQTRNRGGFFRYVGGMAYLEATFAGWFAVLTKTLRNVFGDSVDTRYCDEHAHIDQHHGRMAVHDLVLPLADKHGVTAAREMVRGIEEVRLLGALADADLLAQMRWQPAVVAADRTRSDEAARLGPEAPFETRVANDTVVVSVLKGEAELHWTPTGEPLQLSAGDAVEVPQGRLYGLQSQTTATVSTGVRR